MGRRRVELRFSHSGRAAGLLLLCLWAAATPAAAQSDSERVERALDQPVRRIQIVNQPFKKALDELEDETKLEFEIDDDVLALMPYGDDTRISFVMHDLSARQALTQAFNGLGLTIVVEKDKVRIKPGPLLERLGRKLTVQETALLERLASGPWAQVLQNREIRLQFRVDPAGNPQEQFERAMRQFRGPHALRQLDEVARLLGWVWTPDGDEIVFSSRREDINRRLDRPLDVKFERTPLDAVLTEIARQSGVPIEFEPGVLRQVGARERVVDLVHRRVSARALLERICGVTGLRYEVTESAVRLSAARAAQVAGTAAASRAEPTTALTEPSGPRGEVLAYVSIMVDGRVVLLPVTGEDLPEPAAQALREIIRRHSQGADAPRP